METDSTNNQKQLSKDGSDVVNYLSDMSSKARAVGRSVVFAIIVTSWTLAYSNNVFHPIPIVVLSLALSIVYVFLDLLYYVLTTAVYKYILLHYFNSVEGGFVYKKGKNASSITCNWMKVGFGWMIVISIILLISSLLMILYVLSLANIIQLPYEWVAY